MLRDWLPVELVFCCLQEIRGRRYKPLCMKQIRALKRAKQIEPDQGKFQFYMAFSDVGSVTIHLNAKITGVEG